MAAIVTFGEIMLRLSPPGRERLFQSPRLDAVFGGGEANAAVSLAILGREVRYVSAVPENGIGDAAVRELRKWGVDTSFVLREGRRLGIYFAETGANQRASEIVYDRSGSALAEAKPGDFDWKRIFAGAGWFHVTGITPALSASAAGLTIEAVTAARAARVTISVDLNYRAKLWGYGKSAPEVMREVAKYADLLVGNEEDCQKALGIEAAVDVASGKPDRGGVRAVDRAPHARIPEPRPSGHHAPGEPRRGRQRLVGRDEEPGAIHGRAVLRHPRHRRPDRRRRRLRRRPHPRPPRRDAGRRGPGLRRRGLLSQAFDPRRFQPGRREGHPGPLAGDASGRVRR